MNQQIIPWRSLLRSARLSEYDDYKKDADRFHEVREQHEREPKEAETWERLAELLESHGVDLDEFAATLAKLKKGCDRLGLDAATQNNLMIKMLKLKLGWTIDDVRNEESNGLQCDALRWIAREGIPALEQGRVTLTEIATKLSS